MTQNRLKNAFHRPKKFDDQNDQISYFFYKKVGIYDQNRLTGCKSFLVCKSLLLLEKRYLQTIKFILFFLRFPKKFVLVGCESFLVC